MSTLENEVLASMTSRDFAFLEPHLSTVNLAQGSVLYEIGQTFDRVYFPQSGVISLLVNLGNGETIETGMLGRDSLVGGATALESPKSLTKVIVQIAGTASVLDVAPVKALANKSVDFRSKLMRQEQTVLVQAQQSAACNASHTIEARLSRWLLRCSELMASDSFPLTQQALAQKLGVRRTSVSLVASTLQSAGLIRYKRGQISITDRDGLRDTACECHALVKTYTDYRRGQ